MYATILGKTSERLLPRHGVKRTGRLSPFLAIGSGPFGNAHTH